MYFHQPNRKDSVPNVPANLKPRAWFIDALLPDHHFEFEVQFSNLQPEELNLLLYTLVLERNVVVTVGDSSLSLQGPLRHKIGFAKPLGLGSCQITVERFSLHADKKKRFISLDNPDSLLEGDELNVEIDKRIKGIVADTSPTMEAFRKMMVWDEKDKREFSYPLYTWFKNSVNSGMPLKAI
jgi:hypothetical protein